MGEQDDYFRTQIRFPPELHAKLKEAQKDSKRSFNAEIITRLEASFEPSGEDLLAQLPAELSALIRLLLIELVKLVRKKSA
jgi:hypothetical protein